jgi:hypothetical protein
MITAPSIKTRYDLGLVLQCTNQHGAIVYIFANDVALVDPRFTGVFVYIKGVTEEFWIGGGDSKEQTTKLAEEFVSAVASIRMNGIDKV